MSNLFSFANLPNYFTFFRFITIPFLVYSFYIPNTVLARQISFVLFITSCATDFIDGYLARKFKLTTQLGKILDPIADKSLVISMLFLLVSRSQVNVVPCLLILLRELFISGLREFIAHRKIILPVFFLAKIKTFLQMVVVAMKIIGSEGSGILCLDFVSDILLWIVAFLTVLTGIMYFFTFKKNISNV